jgi:hypothetical protein
MEDLKIDDNIVLNNYEYWKGFLARNYSVGRRDGIRISRNRLIVHSIKMVELNRDT